MRAFTSVSRGIRPARAALPMWKRYYGTVNIDKLKEMIAKPPANFVLVDVRGTQLGKLLLFQVYFSAQNPMRWLRVLSLG